MEINEILRSVREERNLKQEKVAKILGIVQQTYSNYENGNTQISVKNIKKLARYYDVSVDYLLGLTEHQKPVYELESIYVQDRTLGEVTSALLELSSEKRRTMLEFLGYLIEKEREHRRKYENAAFLSNDRLR